MFLSDQVFFPVTSESGILAFSGNPARGFSALRVPFETWKSTLPAYTKHCLGGSNSLQSYLQHLGEGKYFCFGWSFEPLRLH